MRQARFPKNPRRGKVRGRTVINPPRLGGALPISPSPHRLPCALSLTHISPSATALPLGQIHTPSNRRSQICSMAPKRGRRSSKKAAHGVRRDEEWVRSISSEAALNDLVVHDVCPIGWRQGSVQRLVRTSLHLAPTSWSCLRITFSVDFVF